MEHIIIDADNCVAGRVASRVAKELLNGKEVHVINVKTAVISGNKKYVQEFFSQKVSRGDPYHGPFYPVRPDRIFRRIVRGMLPRQKQRGKTAFKRLHVYIAAPEGLEGKPVKIKGTESRLDKFTALGELAEKLGAKKLW